MKLNKSIGITAMASGLVASGLEAEISRAVNAAILEQRECGGNYVSSKAEGRYNGAKVKLLCDSYDGKVKRRA